MGVMFLSLGERFTAGDLNRIRAAESQLTAACGRPGNVSRAHGAVTVLVGYLDRDPDQPLPLHGAGPADSMRAELTSVLRSLSATACAADPSLLASLNAAISRR